MKVDIAKHWKSFALIFIFHAAVQAFGAWCTFTSVSDWYPSLNRPEWRPPNWVFGPVWTLLYIMMAVAVWRVWARRSQRPVQFALGAYGVQLLLNSLWSVCFFYCRSVSVGLIDIALLWIAIGVTLAAFWRVDRTASLLLAPYWAWVSFASALNFAIWRLN
ncbi:MAG: tryptophan-rich sensory protein [bacterium]|nr:tryptophan-rich sensory protein [bacterium]